VFFPDRILTMNDSSSLLNPHNNSGNALPGALPPAEQKRLQQRFEQARRMMEQTVYDAGQVHEMLVECVAKEPANITFVAAMLRNLRRVSAGRPSAKSDGQADPNQMLLQAVDQQDWPKALELGLLALPHTPQDVQTLGHIALACQALGGPKSALLYLDRALEYAPEDPEIHRQAAQILTSLGKIDDALAHWHQVERVDPRDEQSARMISMLTLERIRRPAPNKPTDDENTRSTQNSASTDGLPDEQSGPTDEPTKPQVVAPKTLVLTQRQQLEKAIFDHPEDENLYLKLADLHLAEGRLYEAQRTLQRAASVTSELHVREKLEDVNLLASQAAGPDGSTTCRRSYVRSRPWKWPKNWKRTLQQLEFDTARVRCDRYPDDKIAPVSTGVVLEATRRFPTGPGTFTSRFGGARASRGRIAGDRRNPAAIQAASRKPCNAIGNPLNWRHWNRKTRRFVKVALYRAGLLATEMKLYDSARHVSGSVGQNGFYVQRCARHVWTN
jgi:Flp pilus assembly protein TadD